MHFEIEIKARALFPGKVRERLGEFASFVRKYDKSDSYYLLPGAEPGKGRNFRIRREDGKATVTWKNRSFSEGMEVNIEREFQVSDPEAFLELCLSMGASPYIQKRKIGQAYDFEGFVIELSEVPPLGHFVEIERILEIYDEEADATARPRAGMGPGEGLHRMPESAVIESIRAREEEILERLGIPRSSIEEKPYSLMLREASSGTR